MPSPPQPGELACFADFELDVRTGELRSKGQIEARLSDQPLQILIALLGSPGELVTREDLQRKLWPNDTVVEFGHSIDAAMNRLRGALGDSAKNPQFIETLARRGYRWKGAVEWRSPATRVLVAEPAELRLASHRPTSLWLAGAILLVVASAVLLLWGRSTASRTRTIGEWHQRQLTVNSAENPVTGGAISPDGKYLAFTDFDGMHLRLLDGLDVVKIAEPRVYKREQPNWEIGYWLPDSQHFFAIAEYPQQPSALWEISIAGEPARKLGEGADPWGVSSDGVVALGENDGHEIWALDSRSGTRTLLMKGGESTRFRGIHWSPDGSRLTYIRNETVSAHNEAHIEVLDRRTGATQELASGPAIASVSELEGDFQDLIWFSDDRLIFVGGAPDLHGLNCNLWQIELDPQSAEALSPPEQITNWAGFCVTNLTKTADGKKLAFTRSSGLMNVLVSDYDPGRQTMATPRRLTQTEDMSSSLAWSDDSLSVFFQSNRFGKWGLFRQSLNRSQAVPLVTAGNEITSLALTPDRQWVLYLQRDMSGDRDSVRVLRVATTGGAEEEVLRDKNITLACGASSRGICVLAQVQPSDKEIVFYRLDPFRGRAARLAAVQDPLADKLRWSLSPDGMQAAVFEQYSGQFDLVSFSNRSVRRVSTSPGAHLRTLTWSSAGDGLFACSAIRQGAELLFVDLKGTTHKLWQLDGFKTYLRALSSPDGKHLAVDGSSKSSNLWVLEDF